MTGNDVRTVFEPLLPQEAMDRFVPAVRGDRAAAQAAPWDGGAGDGHGGGDAGRRRSGG